MNLKEQMTSQGGTVISINKPAGWTSFDVIRWIRRGTGIRKVGHAGTLDPMATGVLLVCTGGSTKKVPQLLELSKTYDGTIELGKTTDTDDSDGAVIDEREVPFFSEPELRTVLDEFIGEINQIPPMYSAIKKNGRRLYHIARDGEVIERKSRKVVIFDIVLKKWVRPFLDIKVVCSKGVYIRALARDIGERLGCGGHLVFLQRTRIGSFDIKDSMTLEHLAKELNN